MKVIRLWGVIAFFFLIALFAAGWYLVAPGVVKSGLESSGSEVLGAKVEIDTIELSLFPTGVQINGLQAADPDQPMQNLVEIEQIRFALDTDALLWKKLQIDELNLTGVQVGTKRTTSGELAKGRAAEQLSQQVSSIELPELTESEIRAMVAKADLITVKRLSELDASQELMEAYWKKELDAEENKKQIKVLESDFKRLTNRAKENKMNLLTDRKAWKKLKKDIKKEKKRISSLNEQFKIDQQTIKTQIAAVKAGPKADLKAVMDNIGLGNGVAGLSDKFLGPEFTPWLRKAIDLMSGMKSESGSSDQALVYSTEQGLKVQFKDNQLFPDVLIKKINLSGKDEKWSLNGSGANLGYFPWLVGRPATLDIEMNGSGKADFSLLSDWKDENEMQTKLSSTVDGWAVENFNLMETDLGSWVIKSARLNSSLDGEISMDKLDLSLSVILNQPNIKAPENLTGWQKTMASSLNQQKQLSIDVKLTGTLEQPTFKVNSSLDSMFTQAIGEKVKQQAEKLKGKFSEAISDKVGDLGELEQYTKGLEQWSEKLKLNDGLLDGLKIKF
ncbi:MAG: TIGR03545 family protein [Kangiellaceae bacterium]|nr:TIGR03545 family protein [Kangiellaceae bacterium]